MRQLVVQETSYENKRRKIMSCDFQLKVNTVLRSYEQQNRDLLKEVLTLSCVVNKTLRGSNKEEINFLFDHKNKHLYQTARDNVACGPGNVLSPYEKNQTVIDHAKVELIFRYYTNALCLSAAGRNMPTRPLTHFVWNQSRRFAQNKLQYARTICVAFNRTHIRTRIQPVLLSHASRFSINLLEPSLLTLLVCNAKKRLAIIWSLSSWSRPHGFA